MRTLAFCPYLLAAALALGGSTYAEDAEGRSRLKLEPAGEAPAQSVATDPYDDLGDFVATYTVRRRRPFDNPPVQDVNWGFYHARRRGDWISFSYDLEQPEAVPEGGMATIKERESWIWHRNQFEGMMNNNILTLDPSDVFPDGPLPPFVAGLGWRLDGPDSRPVLQPPGPGDEAWRASLGWGPFATSDLGDGNVEERAIVEVPWGTLEDGTRINRYIRRVRPAAPPAGEARRILLEEYGVRVTPVDESEAFDLPLGRTEAPLWKGKFPSEIRFVRCQVPKFSQADNTWQQLRARQERFGSIDTIMSEFHLVLVYVRTPRADDLIEMRDFESRIAAIRDGRHDAEAEDVEVVSGEAPAVRKWALDENSQMWNRVPPP